VARVFIANGARFFSLWRVKFLLPEPKQKNSRATFFQYTSLQKKTFPAGMIISFYSLLYFVLLGLLRL